MLMLIEIIQRDDSHEIIDVCSQIHIKHINTLCGQNAELLNVKLAVHISTTELRHVIVCNSARPQVVFVPSVRCERIH